MCKVIRDSVNGIKKYCRIPIRRRRAPILAEEFFCMLEHQMTNDLSDDDMKQEAFALCEKQEYGRR